MIQIMAESLTYAASGVDIAAQDEAIRRLKPHAISTHNSNVIQSIGAFAALVQPNLSNIATPLLVSSTDGVGTKLKIAQRFNRHNSIGIDLVATCVNDVICTGAIPLFFLDYIGIHKVEPNIIEQIVEGIAKGCMQAECPLVGGEIAELRDVYNPGEYDLVGFCVGLVDKKKLLGPHNVVANDVVVGISSSGIHSNGYSLVRKVFEDLSEDQWLANWPELGCSLVDSTLTPTYIYHRLMRAWLGTEVNLHALAHISGGGLPENLPRVIPENLHVNINRSLLQTPPIFDIIRKRANLTDFEWFRTFNCGVGLAVILPEIDVAKLVQIALSLGYKAQIIGKVIPGKSGVTIE